MKRQKKKGRTNIRATEKTKVAVLSNSNGITLVALIVSIIVMLILAGVSINAIVGDNGILTQATEAVFLQEITSVKEAYQIWKIDKNETTIPTNGMVSSSELTGTTRLVGEAGYYRTWSISSSKPSTDVTSDADTFNSAFESEFIYYPAGVQDLYYLDTETLGVSVKNTYVIDATNSMIYMLNGATIDGVACYSLEMYYEIKGEGTTPQFAEAEVSGTGSSGTVYAGNVQSEYLEDGSENPDYDPLGFEIIADSNSNNVYKLYNNGDLYGKGVKGSQLNTSESELENIDSTKWSEFTVPSEIGEYTKIISGYDAIYVIDSEGYVWAWGDNTNNKFGLTDEQQYEYTGREATKLDIDGKRVYNIFDEYYVTFYVTTDGMLYAGGSSSSNGTYYVGPDYRESGKLFQTFDVPDARNIENIIVAKETHWVLLEYSDNGTKSYYAMGQTAKRITGEGTTSSITEFVPIWNGYTYVQDENGNYVVDDTVGYNSSLDIDGEIKEVIAIDSSNAMILMNDGNIYLAGTGGGWCCKDITNSGAGIYAFPSTFGTNVKNIYSLFYGWIVEKENGEIWAASGVNDSAGVGITKYGVQVTLPTELTNSGIKEIYTIRFAVYYLSNDGNVYASSDSSTYVGGSSALSSVTKIDNLQISSFYDVGNNVSEVSKEHTSYTVGSQLFLRNRWKIIYNRK